MVHGVDNSDSYFEYYHNVKRDIEGLIRTYPYVKVVVYPYSTPQEIELKVLAVTKHILEECNGVYDDFVGNYSKLLTVIIPYNYKNIGCKIYGAEWLDIERIPRHDQHFNGKKGDAYLFCVGVPESFASMENVVLENVETADNMLVAYESFIRGENTSVELLAYSHGEEGRKEYEKRQRKVKRSTSIFGETIRSNK